MSSANSLRVFCYRAVRLFFRLYLGLIFRVRVSGRHHLPAMGPAIIYANHLSWYDIPVVAFSVSRRIRFMAKAELFRVPFLGRAIGYLGAFPIRRGQPDRQAIRTALTLLKAGEVVGIFPEGTRSKTGQLQRPEPGLAYLAYKSGVPLVPVAISSTYRIGSPVHVRLGPPIQAADLVINKPDGEGLEALSLKLMGEVASLLVQVYSPPP